MARTEGISGSTIEVMKPQAKNSVVTVIKAGNRRCANGRRGSLRRGEAGQQNAGVDDAENNGENCFVLYHLILFHEKLANERMRFNFVVQRAARKGAVLEEAYRWQVSRPRESAATRRSGRLDPSRQCRRES